ncbi:DNA repair helicase XPB [Helcobacillus massiliensis]|uniref:DNA repair helicase XPB n=1 Tax=Helcobacillus massiliensis TaxID=521392 RepID=UPI002556F72D|nr:DNA repair helicase XPB [Helcobacillus massiliensis]MDK7741421.1 DEAD/DEAH box helicase [Helcobacillus massiliensis]WOO92457.1 DEAD/DEAH box helicase [Helcobacillus massiliensis]
MTATGALIVQPDRSILLDVGHPSADEARAAIAPFAELERTPEHIHTYRLTDLGLWNARAAGFDAATVVDSLAAHARFPVAHTLLESIADTMDRYGRLRLQSSPIHGLILEAADPESMQKVLRSKRTDGMLGERIDDTTVVVHPSARGSLKQALVRIGLPAEDFAGFIDGEAHPIALTASAEQGADGASAWQLRDYQQEAVDAFESGGSGVVVLPCGSGKTVVGAASMARTGRTTLILVTNTVSAHQWKRELLRRTTLREDEIGEYSGRRKQIRPVTIATYQVLTAKRKGVMPHLELMSARDWGLVLYDEVHLLPAPVFRVTADLQARRRLGLTATLVREDGRESDVFSLIGPKRFDAPWKRLESQGWIAPAEMVEVRVDMPAADLRVLRSEEPAVRHRMAAVHAAKVPVVQRIVDRHAGEPLLVIGQYVDQLEEIAEAIGAPVMTGRTAPARREELFAQFRSGEVPRLVVSKIANFSVDLPDASVAVQVSGAFGSRQEEAQRLGRLLRPKPDGRRAHFYSLVMRDTGEEEFARHRQRFLSEQGYAYRIVDHSEIEESG